MKRHLTLPLILLLTGFGFAYAQPLQEGKNDIYYHRYISAEKFFNNYLMQHPSDGEAVLLLTKCYLVQHKLPEANTLMASAPSAKINDPYFLVATGAVCLANGKNNDSCRSFFDQAIDMTKGKDPEILGAIAEMETISPNGNMRFALELIQKAMKRSKYDAGLYVLMGNAYRNLHNGGEAFKAYITATQKNKSLAEAYYLLGKIFVSQNNPEMYVGYFNKALDADPNYGPAMYELYRHYLYAKPDAQRAMQYFKKYAAVSDKNVRHEYALTDLLYLNKEYAGAIKNAKNLIRAEKDSVEPRIYKLIGYSYAESSDSLNALKFMHQYFQHGNDSDFIAKDFETMAQLFKSMDDDQDSVVKYYQLAITISKNPAKLAQYYKDLAAIAAANKDYVAQAKWYRLYYSLKVDVSNVDLFNWGIAAYRSNNYALADSVFGLYTEKYPDQGFGYYWRARTNAVIDTGMTAGLAVPYYSQLIEITERDSLSDTDKKWMLEAYGYVAAYEANTQKNYDKAIEYFDKILEIDPENGDALKYISILEATIKKKEEIN
ncbi:MAG TPA: tetratricopeptide repeat protein [Chitinophagaceae bacterium]|nr:tetratricopeptide repeat protein [Chitinophagaceae bacterium]